MRTAFFTQNHRGCWWLLSILVLVSPGRAAEPAVRGMVATAHPVATAVGLDVLKQGGNAVDAAVAIGLTLGVVDGANSGIGGGCFFLLRTADGRCVAIDGRETAPAAATRDMFIRNGKADPQLSQTGALASGVPGALAVYEYAIEHYGKRKLRDLLLPAAALADKGFVLDSHYVSRLNQAAEDLARFDASRAIFFAGGKPLIKGAVLRQRDLARTYRRIAAKGSDWFYRGPFAKAVERWMKQNGGLLTARDFGQYRPVLREPLRTRYRGWEIVGFPPPSSGGVLVAQALNILESFDLKSLPPADRWHVLAESMKLAFADRAWWLGDPDFAPVPRGLVDKQYARELAARIRLDRAGEVPAHGLPPGAEHDLFGKHTTHFSVADAEGNWVACTATINTGFGSKVVVPGTGVLLNNEMDDFSAQPGVANYFGLVGAEANAVAAGKRPLSSMSPTLVLKDGQPIISLGASGGPRIITAVLLNLVNLLDLGLEPADADAQPRIHHQWFPGELYVESKLPADLADALRQRGHRLKPTGSSGIAQIVAREKDGKGFCGAADPRSNGVAAGW